MKYSYLIAKMIKLFLKEKWMYLSRNLKKIIIMTDES